METATSVLAARPKTLHRPMLHPVDRSADVGAELAAPTKSRYPNGRRLLDWSNVSRGYVVLFLVLLVTTRLRRSGSFRSA